MAKEYWQDLIQVFTLNKGKIIGAFIGFIVGILVLFIGLLKTLLILAFTLLGYYLGSRWDLNGDFKKLLDKLLPPQFK
ncbi:MAG: hypothetical protein PWR10_387 [Halanaerobiales bacterium]|nr:hypothetical protein [Halanaerobiales bacterium]